MDDIKVKVKLIGGDNKDIPMDVESKPEPPQLTEIEPTDLDTKELTEIEPTDLDSTELKEIEPTDLEQSDSELTELTEIEPTKPQEQLKVNVYKSDLTKPIIKVPGFKEESNLKPQSLEVTKVNTYSAIGGAPQKYDLLEHLSKFDTEEYKKTLEYLDNIKSEEYTNYLKELDLFFSEQKLKSNLSKYEYIVSNDAYIKKSILNDTKNTIIHKPKYENINIILNEINFKINETEYDLVKLRDDLLLDKNVTNNYDTLKNKYLKLLKQKKIFKDYKNKIFNIVERKHNNTILINKRREIKIECTKILQKIKEINNTTKDREQIKALSKEFIKLNNINSIEKNIRENKIDRHDYSNEYLVLEKPNVKKNIKLSKSNKEPKNEPNNKEPKNEPNKEPKKEPKKIIIKRKTKKKEPKKVEIPKDADNNNNNNNNNNTNWSGPHINKHLNTGKKGPQIIKPSKKITSLKDAKEECKKIEKCGGITLNEKNKFTIRLSDNLIDKDDHKSWVKINN